jgi:hypothetical protein
MSAAPKSHFQSQSKKKATMAARPLMTARLACIMKPAL